MLFRHQRLKLTKDEWAGDAALNFLCREVLLEKFHSLSLKELNYRLSIYVRNDVLTWYARYRGMSNTGCNRLERIIADKIRNNYKEAKALVADIIATFDIVRTLPPQEREKLGSRTLRTKFTFEENMWRLIHHELADEERGRVNSFSSYSDPDVQSYLLALKGLFQQRQKIYKKYGK